MTIKDIAKECGCAIGTVSRVLNNHPDVSEKTRAKVMAVVEKHGFVLNTNARQLKAQERKNLVIIVKGTSSTLLNSLLEKIQKKLEPLPYNANVVILDENDNEGANATRIYFEQKPLGIIFLGGCSDKLSGEFEKVHVPSVLISNQAEPSVNRFLSSVSIDNFEAAYFSARHLIQNGHRKIGVIGGGMTSDLSVIRYNGFRKAMDEAGIPFDFDSAYQTSKYSFDGGAEAAGILLERNPELTAVFTMSDAMAIGACRRIQDSGRRIPDDISIVGFDGLSIAGYFCPRITTIKQDEDQLASEGLAVLLGSIEKNCPPEHKLIPFGFVSGESVRNLNKI